MCHILRACKALGYQVCRILHVLERLGGNVCHILRVWEAHCVVFYVSGRSTRRYIIYICSVVGWKALGGKINIILSVWKAVGGSTFSNLSIWNLNRLINT